MLKINNTLTKEKKDFKPLNPPIVKMYTCGVTVYDSCHIGHARSLYIFDVMHRYLKYRGYDVKFVRNITDIDDKIINRANELKTDWKSLVEKYIASYKKDLDYLGVKEADFEPRATENIPDMIKYIEVLIQKGYAYASGGDVYFEVRKFPEYGKLSRQNIEEMETGVRIEPTSLKKDPLDFALWKASKEGEPFWSSPWGNGRPGWHIECSVMSQKFLETETLDIHAGGRDLIFPHHENEAAQAESYSGKPFAKYWIHHGLLTINGQKMSKSLGNFVTIRDFIEKYKDADLLKIFFLSAQYSHPVDYTNEKIEEAKKAYERIDNLMQKLEQRYGAREVNTSGGTGAMAQFKQHFDEYMDDDFNTPRALSVLFDMVSECNIIIDSDNKDKGLKLSYAMDIIKEMADILGLTFLKKIPTSISENEIIFQISARTAYKKQKQFKEADSIRKNLEEKGIVLEDTKEGTTWRRKL